MRAARRVAERLDLSLFSTIYVRLENRRWGSRFSVLMNGLFPGTLSADLVPAALQELHAVRNEFSGLPPEAMVWDCEDPSKQPPRGTERAAHIKTSAQYFVTSDGKDLFEVMEKAFSSAISAGKDVVVE
jgi:2,3-bisphosphoglycerate-dependent phosphoglycerate mutase